MIELKISLIRLQAPCALNSGVQWDETEMAASKDQLP